MTEYLHVLPEPAAVIDWMRGTGLHPFLQASPTTRSVPIFWSGCCRRGRGYPRQADGRVLFPFRRLFVVAYRR